MVCGGSRGETRLGEGWERGAGLYMIGGGSRRKIRVGEGCERGAGLYMVYKVAEGKHVSVKAGRGVQGYT